MLDVRYVRLAEDLREPLVRRQGSQVSMRVARGSASWLSSHGSDFTVIFHFHALEKEMATHSRVLAWESQGWGSLVGYRLWGRTESQTQLKRLSSSSSNI